MFIKYLRYFLFSLVLYFSINNAYAEKFFYLEQKSSISGLVKIYYNKNYLVINFVQIKIWVIAKYNSNMVTVINAKDKLYLDEKYGHYLGNYAQRAIVSMFKDIHLTNWKLESNENHFGRDCSTYSKVNLDFTSKPDVSFSKATLVPKSKLNFKSLKCTIFNQYKLSQNQSSVINQVVGIKDVYNLPYSFTTIYPNKIENNLITIKTSEINTNLNDLINYSNFKSVEAESCVYDLKSNLTEQMKDFLDLK